MNTTTTTDRRHLSTTELDRAFKVSGDTAATLKARGMFLLSIAADGITVSQMIDDMRAAATSDAQRASILSAPVYGQSAAAAFAVEISGATPSKVSAEMWAAFTRAAHTRNAGAKSVRSAARAAVANFLPEVGPGERLAAIATAIDALPTKEARPSAREARPEASVAAAPVVSDEAITAATIADRPAAEVSTVVERVLQHATDLIAAGAPLSDRARDLIVDLAAYAADTAVGDVVTADDLEAMTV